MTMVVDFADGFVSDESPNLIGLGNEIFPIENQDMMGSKPLVGLDLTGYTSVVGVFEIERKNALEIFRQTGEIMFSRKADGSWSLTLGSYDGDDLATTNGSTDHYSQVMLFMNGEQVMYDRGTMDNYQYEGYIKINISRINA